MLNLKLQNDDHVLVRGDRSGVGIAFLNLVRGIFPKIRVVGTTRNSRKKAQLLDAGYDNVVTDQDGQLQTDQKFSKVLELIGPLTVKDSFKDTLLSVIICSTGELGNQWYLDHFDPITDIATNGYLTSFYSGTINQKKLNQLFDTIEKYSISIKSERIFSLKEVPDAHRYLESSHSLGKVIVLNNHK